MKKSLSILSFTVLGAIAFSSCSQASDPSQDKWVHTRSTGRFLDEQTLKDLAHAQRIKHTFSDGIQMNFAAVGDHIFVEGTDTSLTRRDKLSQFISEHER